MGIISTYAIYKFAQKRTQKKFERELKPDMYDKCELCGEIYGDHGSETGACPTRRRNKN